jgi:NAD(P)-dependent dehydrogenase (short-subunit alcohol dehydrogenase family)
MTYPTDRPATWFVTGASRGLGFELVSQLLERGDNVVATSRSADRLTTALADADTNRLLALTVDLADAGQVNAAIAAAYDRFGGLDVIVNNAGYGYLAAVEEVSDEDARAMFDVQVFGVWNVLRAALPGFREQRSGHVINVSSIVGLVPFPGWGLYGAGKSALEALTESLAAEVADHGIRVNLVEPGYMRTDFLRPVSIGLPDATNDAYPAVREMVRQHLDEVPGTQLGDPAKAAAAIIAVATSGSAPLHQFLGSDSLGLAEGRIQALAADLDASRPLAVTTDVIAPVQQ